LIAAALVPALLPPRSGRLGLVADYYRDFAVDYDWLFDLALVVAGWVTGRDRRGGDRQPRPPAMPGQRPPGSSAPILAALSAQPLPRPEPADLRALTSAVDPTLKALLFGRGLTAQRSGMRRTLCDDLPCQHRDCQRADPDGRRQRIGGPGHVASPLQVARPCRKPRATRRYQRSRSSADADGALNLAAAPDGALATGGAVGPASGGAPAS
jgi:hypothetical protein